MYGGGYLFEKTNVSELEDEDQETAPFDTALQQLEAAPSELTQVARRVAATREDATRFLDWLATQAWNDAASHLPAGPSIGTTCAVETYQLTLQARGALRANTPPQLAVESLLVSWLALRAQSLNGLAENQSQGFGRVVVGLGQRRVDHP